MSLHGIYNDNICFFFFTLLVKNQGLLYLHTRFPHKYYVRRLSLTESYDLLVEMLGDLRFIQCTCRHAGAV